MVKEVERKRGGSDGGSRKRGGKASHPCLVNFVPCDCGGELNAMLWKQEARKSQARTLADLNI